MSKNNILKGVFLVALGATSYGMLATFVKLAYMENYTTAEVLTSQFTLGLLGLILINFWQKTQKKTTVIKANSKDIKQLLLAGTSTGFTGIFYYMAVKLDIPVSICIVLLMQTVWMGVLLEMILTKTLPSKRKIVSVIIVLVGTVLATNLINADSNLSILGLGSGLLAAVSFTATMYTANSIALHISSAQRSLYMLIGGAMMVAIFALITQDRPFNFEIFVKWGIILSLFGTIIPPLLLTAGFPKTGIGLGSIVSSLELPVSVLMAYFILNESVIALQWVGITMILAAIVIMNMDLINFRKK
ncbi:DMT family transporter [Flavobacterium ardleyense]|uniref:DMT family transporter n=1 Tax=Flavobacterium ardleyense TaxID=2038737 RepID=UPI00298C00FA|nr:DMT family transporter [Flavobacterium ardleyense]